MVTVHCDYGEFHRCPRIGNQEHNIFGSFAKPLERTFWEGAGDAQNKSLFCILVARRPA